MSIPYVGKRFTPTSFVAYLDRLAFDGWQPKGVCLHHTASPSLAMRPQGLTDQHLQNLLSYYQDELGWSGAPHLFIDDREDGIIVFQRLDRRGVHARTFNATHWGIEMLGDYDTEDPTTGRGAKVLNNACAATAHLMRKIGVGAEMVFHRDDPKTTKTCPGRHVTVSLVQNGLKVHLAPYRKAAPAPDTETPAPWAREAVAWAQEKGLMQAERPGEPVTRQELAVVLERFAKLQAGQG